MENQFVEIGLTNVELRMSHNSDSSVDILGNEHANLDSPIPKSKEHHSESSVRPPSQNSNERHSRESFFEAIQQTLQHEPHDEIDDYGNITKKVRGEVQEFIGKWILMSS